MSRRGLIAGLTAAALAAAPAAAQAANPPPGPTAAQIKAALAAARRSTQLWATVNICNTKHYPGVIGIRAQMPALGFASRLSMTIQVDYWDAAAKRFLAVPDPGARSTVRFGVVTNGWEQGGRSLDFGRGHKLALRGTVTFAWTRAGKVLGRVTRTTAAGHKDADLGDPVHYSAASCTIS